MKNSCWDTIYFALKKIKGKTTATKRYCFFHHHVGNTKGFTGIDYVYFFGRMMDTQVLTLNHF